MSKSKRVRIPVKQCNRTKKHGKHLNVNLLAEASWCPGKK